MASTVTSSLVTSTQLLQEQRTAQALVSPDFRWHPVHVAL
jgi:hypothetical protein